jgi:hypothetical protein|tara:strand:- start:974 stop:1183 length:210 start_codon:yes stop_codon:yes gene_type:complete
MIAGLKFAAAITQLISFLAGWLRDRQLVDQGRKEQRLGNIEKTLSRVERANETNSISTTVDDDLDELRK